jgi:hypothetical protein
MSAVCDFSGSGPWELPVAGFAVWMITFGVWLGIDAEGEGEEKLTVRLNGPFEFRDSEGKIHHLHAMAGGPEELARVLRLRASKITRAVVTATSALTIEFDTGQVVSAAPYDGYEGWELAGPGFFIVGAGEPAIWTDDSEHGVRGPGEDLPI